MKTPFDNYPTRSIPTASFGSQSYLDLLLLLTTCCNKGTERDRNVASGRPMITVWAHQGKPEEWKTIQSQFERFNASQTNVSARLVEIARGELRHAGAIRRRQQSVAGRAGIRRAVARELRVEGLSQTAGRFAYRGAFGSVAVHRSARDVWREVLRGGHVRFRVGPVRKRPPPRTSQRPHPNKCPQRVDD